MPMAIMRNAHEVIRGAVQQIQACLDDNNLAEASELWQKLDRYQTLHMRMEEGIPADDDSSSASNAKPCQGLFALMDDKANNAATKAGLRDQHTTLDELESQVRTALTGENPSLAAAQKIFPKFAKDNDAHLVVEESVLMPAVQSMIQSGVPVKKHIKTDFLPAVLPDMEFFVTFSCTILEAYELTAAKKQPKTRVFCQALWAIGSTDQWHQWHAWIQQSLSPAKYQQVYGAIRTFEWEQNSAWC